MYNEVRKSCIACGHPCEIQIPQIVLGFGGFNLDDVEGTISMLNEEDKNALAGYINEAEFRCSDCEHSFKVEARRKPKQWLPTEVTIVI